MTNNIIEVRNAILRTDLSSFITKAFETVNPSTNYLHNWHIDIIADKLTSCYEGKITRLVINIPPRNLKSICVSVAWPAWILGLNPAARIMAASYSQILSLKHSLDTRLVMSSNWYRQVFPETIITKDQNEKAKFLTSEQGFRFATSVGGSATGEGGDFLIVDDPHNPLQAASRVQREKAIEWFDQTFVSRLNDKKRGVIVVVMQRLHQEDLTGHLLSREYNGWEHLCIPAIASSNTKYDTVRSKFLRNAGDLLHKEREDLPEIERAKTELGSYAFSAQYQQNPVNISGGMVKLSWFGRY